MRNIFVTLFALLLFTPLFGQELNCHVQINSDKIQGTNKSVFSTLEKAILEFMNERRWTDLAFEEHERIDCTLNMIINTAEGDNFTAEMLVQSRRPVFNSGYTTNLINNRDVSVGFTYREFDPLEFNPTSLSSSLTAVLAYYAYVIIGYDMDSFTRLGGTPYFQVAESIVNQAQSSDWIGWRAFDSNKNRYALISNIMDEAFKKYREYFYEYHRMGLDEMAANVTNGRARIASGVKVLSTAHRSRPGAMVINSFLDAKNDELINIFKEGTSKEKEEVIEVLMSINPSMATRYESINKK